MITTELKTNNKEQKVEITFENLPENMTKMQLSVLVTHLLNKEFKGKILNVSIK